VVEEIQLLIEPWSSEQQQSIEILVDDISFSSAAVNSLVKGPGSLRHLFVLSALKVTSCSFFVMVSLYRPVSDFVPSACAES